jgi:hypothetical protein
MNDTQIINIVIAGQQAIISGVRKENTLFTFGSVESQVAKNNADLAKWNSPIPQTSVESALNRAIKLGHEIAWAIPEACCLVDTATYPTYYADRQAKIDAALRLSVGDVVLLEGRLYRLASASNCNVALIPVAA